MKMADPSGAVRVLHVDDDGEFADLTASFLEREGDRFVVETAEGAGEGLERLAEGQFDCVVSDYEMPGRDGIAFLEAVRERYPDLPFVLFTGKGSEAVASDAISAGVTDYLQKETGTSQYAVLANRIENAVEQRRAREALEASEKRLSLFIEQSPLGVIEWDESFEIEHLNEAAVSILGYDREELIGESWDAIVPESDQGVVGEVVRQLLENEGGFHSVNENVTADGERIICEWHNRVVTDEDGETVAIVSQFQEVTDRVRTRRQLETLLDNVPGYIYRHRNAEGWPLEFVRGSAEAVTGYTAAELEREVGLAEEIIHPEDREYVRTAVEEGLEESGGYTLTYRIVTKDGETRWIWERGGFTETHAGERVLEGFITDFTEEKRRERELEVTRRRLKAILENTPTPMFMKDDEGRYVFVNRGYRELFGVDDGDVVGKTAAEIHGEGTNPQIAENDRRVLEGGEAIEVEERIEVDGEERIFISTKVPIHDTGDRADPDSPVAVFGVATEITERKRRERQLERQNERLEEFASVVSHDLRSPLSVARGRLELLQGECDSDHIDDIERVHARMSDLIDDLLALARQGERVEEGEPVDLGESARDCWRNVVTERGELAVETERTVEADRGRLKQLLENLFRNAVEHGSVGPRSEDREDAGEYGSADGRPPAGDVTITIGDLKDGFYVEDDGPGIPDGERERVFEAGYSTTEEGTGFGLAIVEEVAEAHGWSIRVTEGESGGARFELHGVALGG